MTDETPVESDEIADPIVALRDEMNAQFNEMKESFKAEMSEKDELISQLKEQNTGLQRALVRSAVVDPPKQEVVKTEEELYQDKIDALAKKTLAYMSSR